MSEYAWNDLNAGEAAAVTKAVAAGGGGGGGGGGGLRYRGAYDPAATYATGDIITLDGTTIYIASPDLSDAFTLGFVVPPPIANGAITTAMLAPGAVTENKLARRMVAHGEWFAANPGWAAMFGATFVPGYVAGGLARDIFEGLNVGGSPQFMLMSTDGGKVTVLYATGPDCGFFWLELYDAANSASLWFAADPIDGYSATPAWAYATVQPAGALRPGDAFGEAVSVVIRVNDRGSAPFDPGGRNPAATDNLIRIAGLGYFG